MLQCTNTAVRQLGLTGNIVGCFGLELAVAMTAVMAEQASSSTARHSIDQVSFGYATAALLAIVEITSTGCEGGMLLAPPTTTQTALH